MNGVVVVDKPVGKTSFDVIRDIKRVLQVKKVGHTGTLDPLATGVLPVCINEATKLVQFFSEDKKEYKVTMLLGVETDTFDIEGKVVARREPRVRVSDIAGVLNGFIGSIEQKPPKYSAIKFKGRSLYKWTREGFDIDPQPRTIEIFDIIVEEVKLPYVTFTISCSKGTYIRSLCQDVGKKLRCGACVYALRRTGSGNFPENMAVSLSGVDDRQKRKILQENLISIVDVLPDVCSISIDRNLADRIRKGYQPEAGILESYDIPSLSWGDLIKFLTVDSEMVAIARMLIDSESLLSSDRKAQAVKILRVFKGER